MRVQGKTFLQEGVLEFDGKLHLVDLAGSECAKTAKNVGSSDVRRSIVCFIFVMYGSICVF